MTKISARLCLALVAIGLVAGCASYKPPKTISLTLAETDPALLRSKIVNAANLANWDVCEVGPNDLRADFTDKRWKVYADIHYTETSFEIKPNTKYTTLVDKNGNVAGRVTTIVARLNKAINQRLFLKSTTEPMVESLPKCVEYDTTQSNYTGLPFLAKSYNINKFAWADKPVSAPKDAKFTFELTDTGGVPENLVTSTNERFVEFFSETGNYAQIGVPNAYRIVGSYKDFTRHSHGKADILPFNGSNLVLELETTIYDPSGKEIARMLLTNRTDIGGWSGAIFKGSNKITKELIGSLKSLVDEKLLGISEEEQRNAP